MDRVTIKIPKPLYDNLSSLIAGTGFTSVSEYIIFVMRSLVSLNNEDTPDSNLNGEEVRIIKERLKRLGYL
jgi:metal-responsive CopG/Arc/MetJ family transcriptional regulator